MSPHAFFTLVLLYFWHTQQTDDRQSLILCQITVHKNKFGICGIFPFCPDPSPAKGCHWWEFRNKCPHRDKTRLKAR